VSLLDRAISEEYLRERTSHVAAEKSKPVEAGTRSIVIFRIGREWWALPTEVFQGVEDHSPTHALPHRRNGILNGLVNVRGELLLSISLGALLQLEKISAAGRDRTAPSPGRLLICTGSGGRLVFPVDEVLGVHRYHPKDLRDVPATLAKTGSANYVVGVLPWEDKTVGCMDAELLFHAVDRGIA
jgi:chemotaxis-related protein WspD